MGGLTEDGVDPAMVKEVNIRVFRERAFNAKHDSFGREVSSARTEHKLIKIITLSPGKAVQFDWTGGHVHDEDVWRNVVKEMKAAKTVKNFTRDWEPVSHPDNCHELYAVFSTE